MMQVTKKKSSQIDFNYLENCILSIQLSLDGFSFCVFNTDLKEIIALSSFDFFDKNTTPEALLTNINKLYAEEAILSKQFKSVNVSIKNNLNTFVPADFFDPNLATNYLQHTVKILKNDFIAFDELTDYKLINVYIPYVNITNYFLDLYGPYNYQHTATVLVNQLAKLNNEIDGKRVYVHVSKSDVEIIAFSKDQLMLYNTHKITSAEDFLYYILFTFEQLELNPNKHPLILLGSVYEDTAYVLLAKQYITNISFLTYSFSYPSELLNNIASHEHFVVLNQF